MVIISLLLIMVKNNTNIPISSILYTLQMLNIPKNRDYYNATFFTVLPPAIATAAEKVNRSKLVNFCKQNTKTPIYFRLFR